MSKKYGLGGSTVTVQNDNVEKALRLFKKKINEDGKLQDLRDRECYDKPSIVKRRKKNQESRRAQKKREAAQLPKRMY